MDIIRYEYVKLLDNQVRYAAIDSFPCLLCTTIRNRYTKLFSEIVNIGYNVTNGLYYYGFKISLSIDSKGFPVVCEVISASVHYMNMAHDLVEQSPNKQILADDGYVSNNLKQASYSICVYLWTPPKKSQKSRETIEDSLLSIFQKK